MNDIPNPAEPVSHLGETLAQTTESHRVLVQEMTAFAKDESLRFVNLRLERNGTALDKLQNCVGLPGLIGVQQEWLRDMLQDYTGQGMRLMGALRGLSRNVMACAAETASDSVDHMQQAAGEMMNQAGSAMDQVIEPVNQDTDTYVQATQH